MQINGDIASSTLGNPISAAITNPSNEFHCVPRYQQLFHRFAHRPLTEILSARRAFVQKRPISGGAPLCLIFPDPVVIFDWLDQINGVTAASPRRYQILKIARANSARAPYDGRPHHREECTSPSYRCYIYLNATTVLNLDAIP